MVTLFVVAGVVFRTALHEILRTQKRAEIWDVNQYPQDVRAFLGNYNGRYDIIGENKE